MKMKLGLNVELPWRLSVILTKFNLLCHTSWQKKLKKNKKKPISFLKNIRKKVRCIRVVKRGKCMADCSILKLPLFNRILFMSVGKCYRSFFLYQSFALVNSQQCINGNMLFLICTNPFVLNHHWCLLVLMVRRVKPCTVILEVNMLLMRL